MKKIPFFIFLFLTLSLQAQIETPMFNPSYLENYTHPAARPLHYLLADSVILRKSADRQSTALNLMRIGQAFVIDERSGKRDTLNGVISNWYRISYDNQSGYIWGGFIAFSAFGSHADGAVKFYYGLSRELDTGKYPNYLAQIRAVRNGQLLAKKEFPYNPDFWPPSSKGPCGLKLHDIITWHLPCEGGCGCSTGDYYIFWDGKEFSPVYSALGTADAWASGGSTFIFPCDIKGEADLVIRHTDDFLDETPQGYKRFLEWEYFIFNNGQLQAAPGRAKKREEYYSKN